MSNKEIFLEYEELQTSIKELEERRDALKPQILELITVEQKVPVSNGSITVECRKKWKFSEDVASLEDELEKTKEAEMQTGIATYVNGEPYVKYYPNKKIKT
jgi:hypothetical protein